MMRSVTLSNAVGWVLFFGGFVVPGPCPARTPPAVPDADLKAVVAGNNAFAFDLYKKLAEKTDGNVVLSPYSISSALAMTYAGARGTTAEEMAKVLGLTELADRAHPAHAALARTLRGDGGKGGPEFHVANALWGQRGLPFRPEFLRLTRDHYGAGLREVDFAGDTDGSRRTINAWVGEQTREKIPELLKPTDLSPASKLVLTNAVYFKADWAFPFKKEDTKDGPFRVSATKTVTVPLMTRTARLRYAEIESAQVLELPYAGGAFSMVVILPVKLGDLGRVEAAITGGSFGRWLAVSTPREVVFTVPKSHMRSVSSLETPLEKLGIRTAFSPNADFAGMAATGGSRITRVVHEATVEWDEQGTVASAGTAVILGKAPEQKVTVRLDRPFLFVVTHRNSGTVLFLARGAHPNG